MDNKKMLDLGIQTLQSLNAEHIESVELETNKYDDGTVGYSVNIMLLKEESASERK